MKKSVIAVGMVVVLFVCALPAPVVAAPQLFGREPKKEDKTRLLTGKVIDSSDAPLPNAVVYLTNTRDHSVKTYIVSTEGTYRFPALQPTIDYEVYAQFNKRRSHTKTVSQFDDRQQVYIDLKIDTKAESK
ncbi:MAG: carboxypeptidase-like regulatory domain-containing protein [Terriglobales bacterium]